MALESLCLFRARTRALQAAWPHGDGRPLDADGRQLASDLLSDAFWDASRFKGRFTFRHWGFLLFAAKRGASDLIDARHVVAMIDSIRCTSLSLTWYMAQLVRQHPRLAQLFLSSGLVEALHAFMVQDMRSRRNWRARKLNVGDLEALLMELFQFPSQVWTTDVSATMATWLEPFASRASSRFPWCWHFFVQQTSGNVDALPKDVARWASAHLRRAWIAACVSSANKNTTPTKC